jgi:hypothetical protein
MIVDKVFSTLLLPKVFHRVGPKDIAHETVRWWLTEAIDLGEIVVKPQTSKTGSTVKWDLHTTRRSSRVFNSGERPPCIQRNCLFMTAARGRAQKESMHASYMRSEYLCLPMKEDFIHRDGRRSVK